MSLCLASQYVRLTRWLWRLVLALVSALALAARVSAQAPAVARAVPGAPAGVTAFVGVAVVPMDSERVLPNQTVLVAGGRITALGPVGKLKVPAGAVRIDGRGQYLLPGLADMHAHLGASFARRYDTVMAEQRLFLWLAHGVTTIRNLDYTPAVTDPKAFVRVLAPASVLGLRARAAAGELWSPRIYTSGPWAVKPAEVPPDSVATYVAAYRAAGYDFLKPHDESAIVIDSLAAAVRRAGLPLAGHVTGASVEHALASGAYASIEHLTGYDNDLGLWRPSAALVADTARLRVRIAELAAAPRRAGVWNCPTQLLEERQHKAGTPARRQLIKALQDAGAGLLLGTDTPVARRVGQPDTTVPGERELFRLHGDVGAVHGELAALARAGLTPYQALLTGTRNVAEYFGTLTETGTVAVGKRADLLLLAGNPLADLRHAAQPAGVMLGGRWLARAELDRRLAALKDSLALD